MSAESSPAVPAEQRAGGRGSFRVGMGFNALSFLAMAVLGVVSTIATARLYGVRSIGEFALVMAPVEAMWFLSSVREQAALVRELTQLPARSPRITGLFVAVLGFSTAFTVAISVLATVAVVLVFNGPIDQPDLIVPALISLVGYIVLTNVGWNIDATLAAFVAGRELFWVRLNQNGMFLVFAIVLGLGTDSLWGLVAATYLSAGTSLVHRIWCLRRFMLFRVERRTLAEGFDVLPALIRFGLKLTPGSIASGVATQAATWTLGVVASVTTVGAFNRAQLLSRRFEQLNSRIAEMLFPTLVARRHAGDGDGFDRALIDTIRYSSAFMLLIGAVGSGAAVGIMELFGPGFLKAAGAFAWLLFMPFLTTLIVIQRHALIAVDRPGLTSVTGVVRMVLTVGLTVALTLAWGLVGPAIALVAGAVIEVVWTSAVVHRYLSRPLRVLWSTRQIVALVAASAVAFGTARGLDLALDGLVWLPLILAAGTLAYAATFALLGGINARDRERFGGLTRRLRRRPAAVA